MYPCQQIAHNISYMSATYFKRTDIILTNLLVRHLDCDELDLTKTTIMHDEGLKTLEHSIQIREHTEATTPANFDGANPRENLIQREIDSTLALDLL